MGCIILLWHSLCLPYIVFILIGLGYTQITEPNKTGPGYVFKCIKDRSVTNVGCKEPNFQLFSDLKEYAHKDYLLFQKKGIGETNILQRLS